MRKYQKVLVIIGPTSSGKSALSIALAKKFNGEVVSADSRQVYKGLNIGTGKITRREMKGIRHHLLDVVSPKKIFTAHDFVKQGRNAIEDIASRGKLPILAGGTGFYIDALFGRVALPDVPANPKLRAKLEQKTAAQLFALLKRKDPRRARNIDPYNRRRLIRALEIASALGRVPTSEAVSLYDVLWVGLTLPKIELQRKIAARLRERVKQGMVTEARHLYKAGLTFRRMEQLGLEYRALARHLQSHVTRKEMAEELNRDILRYAKKQMTYWRQNKDIRWFPPSDVRIVRFVRKFLSGR